MIRLKDTRYPNTAAFLASAISIAEYYGFTSLDTIPKAAQRETGGKRAVMPLAKVENEITFARRDERALLSSARKCLVRLPVHEDPRNAQTLLAWRTVVGNSGVPSVSFELHVVGSPSAIAEALLIVVGNAIAEESGIGEHALAINNIGSSESSNRYIRDIGLYLRKHI